MGVTEPDTIAECGNLNLHVLLGKEEPDFNWNPQGEMYSVSYEIFYYAAELVKEGFIRDIQYGDQTDEESITGVCIRNFLLFASNHEEIRKDFYRQLITQLGEGTTSKDFLCEADRRATEVLEQHREELEQIMNFLIDKREVSGMNLKKFIMKYIKSKKTKIILNT